MLHPERLSIVLAVLLLCILTVSCSGEDATPVSSENTSAIENQSQNTPTPSSSTAVATSTMQPPVSPLASETTTSEGTSITVAAPTPHTGWQVFRGENAYGPDYPEWGIYYNPADWRLEGAPAQYNQTLIHNEMDGCHIWLNAGPLGAPKLAETVLAGRKWNIDGVVGCNLLHITGWQGVGYFLGIRFPEDCELDHIVPCLVEAEKVIDTFSIVEE